MLKTVSMALGLCLVPPAAAVAAPITTGAYTGFDFVWDFGLTDDGVGAINDNLDLYDNATGAAGADGLNDWTVNANGSSVVISDGVMNLTNVANGNAIWAAASTVSGIDPTTGYTIETRVQMDPNTTASNNGGLILDANLAVGTPAGSNSPFAVQYPDMEVGSTLNVYYDLGPTGPVYATVAAADFFTVRITATPDAGKAAGLAYSLYVNGVLVGDDLDPERTSIAARRLLIGDIGGGARGVTSVDYVAFTPGAFAPVPEPASLALLAIGAGVVCGRRRADG